MADFKLDGRMKVKTLKAQFKENFGATLRVYKSTSCMGGFAEDNATLASIRAEGAKGGELVVKGNMKVENFEKKVAELYGIGVQVATPDDSRLSDNAITLAAAGRESGEEQPAKTEEDKTVKTEVVVQEVPNKVNEETERVMAEIEAAKRAAEAELQKLKAEAEAAKLQAEKEAAEAKAEIERAKAEAARAQADKEAAAAKAAAEIAKAEAEAAKVQAEKEAAEAKAAIERAKAETVKVQNETATSVAGFSTYKVCLKNVGEAKLCVVKVVKEVGGFDLKEAKDLVDGAPSVIKSGISKVQAEHLKKVLEDAGATVELLPSGVCEGALPGVFTLKDGKKIRFSMGNLQFHPKKYEFRFAKQQYERLSKEDNEKCSPTLDGWIDIFGWGTSGFMGCQPTEDDLNAADYGPKSGDLTGANANYDWGVFNPIANGGNKEGLWRTPSAEEWDYLANQRPNADKLKVKCTVCGVEGFMLMPDDFWNNRLRIAIDITTDSCSDNKFDIAQWAQLEELGAVFFSKAYTKYFSDKTWYWSQTWCYHTSTRYTRGYFSGIGVDRVKVCKYPVRLIQDVK